MPVNGDFTPSRGWGGRFLGGLGGSRRYGICSLCKKCREILPCAGRRLRPDEVCGTQTPRKERTRKSSACSARNDERCYMTQERAQQCWAATNKVQKDRSKDRPLQRRREISPRKKSLGERKFSHRSN